MFDRAQFVADCRAALGSGRDSRQVRDVVAAAIADPAAVLRHLGAPQAGGVKTLHRGADLTVINVIWPPRAVHRPHDHTLWAVIGVYAGREDNILWRRVAGAPDGRIDAAGAKSVGVGEALALGPDAIHSVVNPTDGFTCALQVYGGDFFAVTRSEWDPQALTEQPYDRAASARVFAR